MRHWRNDYVRILMSESLKAFLCSKLYVAYRIQFCTWTPSHILSLLYDIRIISSEVGPLFFQLRHSWLISRNELFFRCEMRSIRSLVTLRIKYQQFSRCQSSHAFCRICKIRFCIGEEIISHGKPRKHYHPKCAKVVLIID